MAMGKSMTNESFLSREMPDVNKSEPGFSNWRGNLLTPGVLQPGTIILGHYKVVSELGKGGMGIVYKCFDEVSLVHVAVKTLAPELYGSWWEMEQIRKNFELVHNLHHPHIAAYNTLERDKTSGLYYLVMEYVDGEDLRYFLRRKRESGEFNEALVCNIVRQIAEAVDFAHSEKILHRDIKPANVMISHTGKVKVLDFGLASQLHSSLSKVTSLKMDTSGTLPYIAPEQWNGIPAEEPADQYALAATVYEMFAGRPPFDTSDKDIMRDCAVNRRPLPLKNVSDSVQYAVNKALSKEPARRFRNCCAFADALSRKRRRPLWFGIIAAVITLLLLAALGLCVPKVVNRMPWRSICTLADNGKRLTMVRSDAADKTFSFPDTVKIIDTEAFKDCAELTAIEIPEGVESIADRAFLDCRNLNKVVIPRSVKLIGKDIFKGCSKLQTLVMYSTWKDEYKNWGLPTDFKPVFIDKEELIEAAKKEYGLLLDEDAAEVTGVADKKRLFCKIPSWVRRIGSQAFQGMKLKSIELNDMLEHIGNEAFLGCHELELVIPKNVKTIGSRALNGVKRVEIAPGNKNFSSPAAGLIMDNANGQLIYEAPESGRMFTGSAGNVLIEKSSGCLVYVDPDLTELTLNENITEVRANVFRYCGKLKQLIIPDKFYKKHGDWGVNKDCRIFTNQQSRAMEQGLTLDEDTLSVVVKFDKTRKFCTVPDGVKKIAEGVFAGCRELELKIPKDVEDVGTDALNGVKKIEISPENKKISVPVTGVITIKSSGRLIYVDPALTELTLPESVAEVPADVFKYCSELKQLIIPDRFYRECSVWGVNKDCRIFTRLQQKARKEGLTLDEDTLSVVVKFDKTRKNSTIPDGVKEIADGVFANCSDLELIVPASVEKIGRNAFSGIKSVQIYDANRYYKSFDGRSVVELKTNKLICWMPDERGSYKIPEIITEITENLFAGNRQLKSIELHNNIRQISDGAFRNCTNLEYVLQMPPRMTVVGEGMFENCTSLRKVILSAATERISKNAFRNCTALELELPEKVREIGGFALEGVKKVTVSSGNKNFYREKQGGLVDKANKELVYLPADIKNCELGEDIKKVRANVFSACKNLRTIIVPEQIKNIPMGQLPAGCSVKILPAMVKLTVKMNYLDADGSGKMVEYIKQLKIRFGDGDEEMLWGGLAVEKNVKPGRITVEVSAPWCDTQRKVLEVGKSGAEIQFDIKARSQIKFVANRVDVEFTVLSTDREKVGSGKGETLKVDAFKNYTVKAVSQGQSLEQKIIDIKPGETKELKFEFAAKVHSKESVYQQALKLLDEDDPEKYEEIVLLLQEAAQAEHVSAAIKLSELYRDGRSNGVFKKKIVPDREKAEKWLRLAAKCGNVEAAVKVADNIRDGKYEGTGSDLLRLYGMAIKAKNSYAAYEVVKLYRHGDSDLNIPEDRKKETEYLKKAVELGHPQAMFELGKRHKDGDTEVLKDERECVRLIKKAAELEYSEAEDYISKNRPLFDMYSN